jgi:hypothetical protein
MDDLQWRGEGVEGESEGSFRTPTPIENRQVQGKPQSPEGSDRWAILA